MDEIRMEICGPNQPEDQEPHLFCQDNPPNEFQRSMGSYSCTGLRHVEANLRILCTHDCHNYKKPELTPLPGMILSPVEINWARYTTGTTPVEVF